MAERILIIDDEPYILMILEEILRTEGYETESTGNGAAALEALRRRPFDLVIVDQRLPDMTGLEILAEVQKIQPTAVTILLTGHASLDTAIEALRRGASDYLLKPSHAEELKWSVRKALERKRVSETAQFQKKMDLLYHVGQSIAGETRLDPFLKTLAEKLPEVLELPRCFVFLADEEEKNWILHASSPPLERPKAERTLERPGAERSIEGAFKLPFRKGGALREILRQGREISIEDPKKDRRLPSPLRRLPLGALLIAPILFRERLWGVLAVDAGAPHRFTESETRLTRFLADQAAIGIENIRRQEDLKRLSLKALLAQEEERKRISRELHDATGQSLLALKLHLEMLAERTPPEMKGQREEIAEAHAITGRAIEEIRRLVADLRPTKLDDLGLVPTLRGEIQAFSKKFKIRARLTKVKLLRRLPAEIETALYRILQEALTNVAKHAKATEVSLSLERIDHRVRAAVVDNGIGFDAVTLAKKRARRFGLIGIQERVDLMGGSLEIISRRGRGTELRVEIPLRAPSRRPERAPAMRR